MFIIDAHQDLAYNALNFGREYTHSAYETRKRERLAKSHAVLRNGDTLLGYPEYKKATVAVIVASLFSMPARCSTGDWDLQVYDTMNQAHKNMQTQLDHYVRWTDKNPEKFRMHLNKTEVLVVRNQTYSRIKN